ncbi:hypothetical protein EHH54_34690 [Rhizobium leguminosarum]|uniref:hypothetical protein n=1 Tax=Rhizobium leguminosarum TaxID=384 RepID=UPI000FEC5F41|nr:hypothetical protein [Rhizobium leguminosarum]RWX26615.1 hypothetical protein EHH54_34690 [Rhizobium leguminosarum]
MQNRRQQPVANTTNRYTPAPYAGTGTEVIDNLDANIPTARLLAVAAWHSKRHGERHKTIAARLREAANDNTKGAA